MDLILQNIFDGLGKCYGLDWATMFLGIMGAYFLSKKDRRGIIFNFVSCCVAFPLAIICNQYGLILYNIIFAIIMIRAYCKWSVEDIQAA